MIITTKIRKSYTIEMTETQARNLFVLLTTTNDGHVNELTVQAELGSKVADEVHETLDDLRQVLEISSGDKAPFKDHSSFERR